MGVAARNFKDKPRLQIDFDKLEKKVPNAKEIRQEYETKGLYRYKI